MKDWEINPFVRWAGTVCNYERGYFCAAYDARILFVLCGGAEFEIKTASEDKKTSEISKYSVRENCLVYVPPGTGYRIKKSAKEFKIAAINFDFTYDYSNQSKVLKMKVESQFNEKKAHIRDDLALGMYKSPFVIRQISDAERDIKEVLEEFDKQYKYYRETSSAILKKILFRLAVFPKSDSKTEDTFSNFEKYVEDHYSEDLNNTDIAEALCYHPNYLSRVIKNRTGKSMHRYIMEYRIMQASKLLNSTNLPISDVARKTGFKNSDHFSAYFKKITGVNAKEYSRFNV